MTPEKLAAQAVEYRRLARAAWDAGLRRTGRMWARLALRNERRLVAVAERVMDSRRQEVVAAWLAEKNTPERFALAVESLARSAD